MELFCTYNSRVATAKKIIAKVEQKYQGIEINLGTVGNIATYSYGHNFKVKLARYLQNRIKAVQVQA